MPLQPVIPKYITVHLGPPGSDAQNATVPFIDYLKNVASSEIYPTWPEAALRANIFAQTTFALNRIYTEWYRSRGYDFDITNDTRYDQKFIPNREVYDSVSRIVDEQFNSYVVRNGFIQPLFTQYCNGTTAFCRGLSQWGSVGLAQEGLNAYQILQYYYGNDISIVFNAPVSDNTASYPGRPLRVGMVGEEIRLLKIELNRIGRNYPAIGSNLTEDVVFSVETENAVKRFQSIFNLTPDGIVGPATWYRIKDIFNGVKGLAELQGEGLRFDEIAPMYASAISLGSAGDLVGYIQYYLYVISYFDDDIPILSVDGIFGPQTERTVRAFQQKYGLTVDGIVGRQTYSKILEVYDSLLSVLPQYTPDYIEIFPGVFLTRGAQGQNVSNLQTLINRAAARYPNIPSLTVDGVFGAQTENAVRVIQQFVGRPVTGFVGPLTWYAIVNLGRDQGD